MKARDWWLGVTAIVLAIVFHALFPRYDFRITTGGPAARIDRWTGDLQVARDGQWRSLTSVTDDELARFLREHPNR